PRAGQSARSALARAHRERVPRRCHPARARRSASIRHDRYRATRTHGPAPHRQRLFRAAPPQCFRRSGERRMTDEIQQLLKALHLRKIAEILDDELVLAEKEDRSYQELVVRLLRAQWHTQQENALAWRIERAR